MPITPKFTAGASFMTSPHCELTCLTVSMKCGGGLRLSASKTEFIWCAASRCRHRIPTNYVQVGPDSVSSARDLGVYIDASTTMPTHINHVVSSSCFGALRQMSSIENFLPLHALNAIFKSLVHSRLDYCNGDSIFRTLSLGLSKPG